MLVLLFDITVNGNYLCSILFTQFIVAMKEPRSLFCTRTERPHKC